MIRLVGVVMLLAGFAITFVQPWFVARFADFEIISADLFSPQTGFVPLTVELTPEDAPVLYRLDVALNDAEPPAAPGIALALETRTGAGLALDDALLVAAPGGAVRDGLWSTTLATDSFDVGTADDYTITMSLADTSEDAIDALASVSLTVVGNAGVGQDDWQPLGYILIIVGSIAYMVGRRPAGGARTPRHSTGKPSNTSQIGRKTPLEESLKPTAPGRPKRKWGRAGSDKP